MMTILNALRTAPQNAWHLQAAAMAALADAGDDRTMRRRFFFREKAFWKFGRGQRLGDLRRLVRQYGRTQDKVFPDRQFFTRNGTPPFPASTDRRSRSRSSTSR